MLPKCVTDRIASAQCPSSYQMSAESVERSVEVDMKHQIRGAGVHGSTSLLCRMCRSLQVMETSGFTGAVEQRDLCCHRDNHCMYRAGIHSGSSGDYLYIYPGSVGSGDERRLRGAGVQE